MIEKKRRTIENLQLNWERERWSNQNYRRRSSFPAMVSPFMSLWRPLWSYQAIKSHHCYHCRCAASFFFTLWSVFPILYVRVSIGMSWVYNLSHCCGQCSNEHVCKNSLLLNVSYNCLMKCLKEIWPIDATIVALWELNDKSGVLQYNGWCMYE